MVMGCAPLVLTQRSHHDCRATVCGFDSLQPIETHASTVRHAFFETDNHIEINIFVKDVVEDAASVQIEPKKVMRSSSTPDQWQ